MAADVVSSPRTGRRRWTSAEQFSLSSDDGANETETVASTKSSTLFRMVSVQIKKETIKI